MSNRSSGCVFRSGPIASDVRLRLGWRRRMRLTVVARLFESTGGHRAALPPPLPISNDPCRRYSGTCKAQRRHVLESYPRWLEPSSWAATRCTDSGRACAAICGPAFMVVIPLNPSLSGGAIGQDVLSRWLPWWNRTALALEQRFQVAGAAQYQHGRGSNRNPSTACSGQRGRARCLTRRRDGGGGGGGTWRRAFLAFGDTR